MRGNTFGRLFSITSYGESHGDSLGVIIDGMPSNIKIDLEELQAFMDRRRPGRLKVSSSRNEKDIFHITSGIFKDKSLGTPIHVQVKNQNQISSDYSKLKDSYRPGHADKTTQDKFGIRDYRGGGRASGRETLSRVIGGFFAKSFLSDLKLKSYIVQLGSFEAQVNESIPLGQMGFADPKQEKEIENFLLTCKKNGESCGGIIEVRVSNMPNSLGEPVFDKLKATLSHGIMSIGSCMGVSFGRGFEFAKLLGSEISKHKENFGGIEGGISNGEDLRIQCYFKAPSTVGENARQGRHDPCILPRVRVVVESMIYITIADHYLRQNAYKGIS